MDVTAQEFQPSRQIGVTAGKPEVDKRSWTTWNAPCLQARQNPDSPLVFFASSFILRTYLRNARTVAACSFARSGLSVGFSPTEHADNHAVFPSRSRSSRSTEGVERRRSTTSALPSRAASINAVKPSTLGLFTSHFGSARNSFIASTRPCCNTTDGRTH